MTREEAIKHLKDIRNDMWTIDSEVDAINMAIEVLEQPEIIRCWECKWHEGTNFCGNFNVIGFYPNDYCSLAERRTNGET